MGVTDSGIYFHSHSSMQEQHKTLGKKEAKK